MTTMHRMNIAWSGFPGGPGVTVLYFADGPAAQGPVGTWIDAWKYLVPSNITLTVPAGGDVIDAATGTITGQWVGGAATAHVGTGAAGSYAAASGACVTWLTGVVTDGRLVRGRSYLVPLTALAYDAGTLVDTAVTALSTSSNVLAHTSTVQQYVWHRPRTTPTPRVGSAALVNNALVRDKQATLRSRRD